MDDKVSGLRVGSEVFVSFKDDNGQIVSGYFVLVSLSETFVQLKTNQNILLIPITQLLKIKQRGF